MSKIKSKQLADLSTHNFDSLKDVDFDQTLEDGHFIVRDNLEWVESSFKFPLSSGTPGQILSLNGQNELNWSDTSNFTELFQDPSPRLGADLDLNNHSIVAGTNATIEFSNNGVSLGTITSSGYSGNAASATQATRWSNSRSITFSGGDVGGSFSLDGSSDIPNVDLTIEDLSVTNAMLAGSIELNKLVNLNSMTILGNLSNSSASPTTVTVLDEDNMSSNSATGLATQQSIKAYVDTQITAQYLDFTTSSGVGVVDLDDETLAFAVEVNKLIITHTNQTIKFDVGSDIVQLTEIQTLTNKTLTTPTIATINSGSDNDLTLTASGTGDVKLVTNNTTQLQIVKDSGSSQTYVNIRDNLAVGVG